MLEEQRRAAVRALHHAVGDLADLELGAHGMRDAHQLTDRVDSRDEIRRSCRCSCGALAVVQRRDAEGERLPLHVRDAGVAHALARASRRQGSCRRSRADTGTRYDARSRGVRSRAARGGSRSDTECAPQLRAAWSSRARRSARRGAVTRSISRSPASRSSKLRAPKATMIPSQLSSASGRRSASATTGRTGSAARLRRACAQHWLREIGADHLSRERGLARDGSANVERARAEIDVHAARIDAATRAQRSPACATRGRCSR